MAVLPFLRTTTISGAPANVSGVTVDPELVYLVTAAQLHTFGLDGTAGDSFPINGADVVDAAQDSGNIYLVASTNSLILQGIVRTYTKRGVAGREFSLEPIIGIADATFYNPVGAIIRSNRVVTLQKRTQPSLAYLIAEHDLEGQFVYQAAVPITDTDTRSLVQSDNAIYVLTDSHLRALSTGYTPIAADDVTLSFNTGVGAGWDGKAVVVYDSTDGLQFYGEAKAAVTATAARATTPQLTGFEPNIEKASIAHRQPDGTFDTFADDIDAAVTRGVQEEFLPRSLDVASASELYTVVPVFAEYNAEVSDRITLANGVELTVGNIASGGYHQVLYASVGAFEAGIATGPTPARLVE